MPPSGEWEKIPPPTSKTLVIAAFWQMCGREEVFADFTVDSPAFREFA